MSIGSIKQNGIVSKAKDKKKFHQQNLKIIIRLFSSLFSLLGPLQFGNSQNRSFGDKLSIDLKIVLTYTRSRLDVGENPSHGVSHIFYSLASPQWNLCNNSYDTPTLVEWLFNRMLIISLKRDQIDGGIFARIDTGTEFKEQLSTLTAGKDALCHTRRQCEAIHRFLCRTIKEDGIVSRTTPRRLSCRELQVRLGKDCYNIRSKSGQ